MSIKMSTSRRTALKTIASAAVAAPLGAQHEHHAALVQIAGTAPAYKPKFFTPSQYETLKTLVDLILPRTDTPGASDAGAHRIIDTTVSRSVALQKEWSDGLAWLEKQVGKQSKGKTFRKLPEQAQVALLNAASESGASFFRLLKGATVDAYYSTKEGLSAELGWNANTFLPEFKGCTHKDHQG